MFFSIEEIDFGELEKGKTEHRMIILYNQSTTHKLTFKFKKTGLIWYIYLLIIMVYINIIYIIYINYYGTYISLYMILLYFYIYKILSGDDLILEPLSGELDVG